MDYCNSVSYTHLHKTNIHKCKTNIMDKCMDVNMNVYTIETSFVVIKNCEDQIQSLLPNKLSFHLLPNKFCHLYKSNYI